MTSFHISICVFSKLLEGFPREPLVPVRDAEGVIRCLSNVCTHRGNIVVGQACRLTHLRCRYHGVGGGAWVYGVELSEHALWECASVYGYGDEDAALTAMGIPYYLYFQRKTRLHEK